MCADLPVKYDDIGEVRYLFRRDRPVRWLATLDLKDGYHHFALDPTVCKFL